MKKFTIALFMGSERSGIYEVTKCFQDYGLSAGMPFNTLRNHLTTRNMPAYIFHWYWTAIRRFFEDMGLPAIAEVPEDRISSEERAYYTRMFARCLFKLGGGKPYVCADSLTSLVLPMVLDALAANRQSFMLYFFFSHPAREIVSLKRDFGQARQLSEFIWRNITASAILHGGHRIRFIEREALDKEIIQKLAQEIYGTTLSSDFYLPSIQTLPTDIELSAQTMELYNALCAYVRNENTWKNLEDVALTIFSQQTAQNGWQYVDCIDCGEMDAHAKLLLSRAGKDAAPGKKVDENDLSGLLPENEAGWLALLDQTEQKILDARHDFETRLFMHSDSLHRACMQRLEDERQIIREKDRRAKEKSIERRRRHKARLRALFEKIRNEQ